MKFDRVNVEIIDASAELSYNSCVDWALEIFLDRLESKFKFAVGEQKR